MSDKQDRFVRPTHVVLGDDLFKGREVGVTHPDNPSFIRVRDNGDIEIVAAEGLGMVFSVARRNVTIFADEVKFLTKESAGLRWNKTAFNPNATNYSEPTLTKLPEDQVRVDLFQGVSHYLDD